LGLIAGFIASNITTAVWPRSYSPNYLVDIA
jgi:hypothetical protein